MNENFLEKVSVIMPVFNGERYLKKAIESILNQTYKEIEFLIIDDGSTDKSVDIASSFKDERIRLYKNGHNQGIVYTLNRGIELSEGTLLARMDCDDISDPHRLDYQVQEFTRNAKLVLCSTWCKTIYKDRFLMNNHFPITDGAIKAQLLFSNAVCHPSVMMRKSMLTSELRYNSDDFNCEDYGLWSRMIDAGEFYNIPKYLLRYRWHDANVSNFNQSRRGKSEDSIKSENFSRLLKSPDDVSWIFANDSQRERLLHFANTLQKRIIDQADDYKKIATSGLFWFLVDKIGLIATVRRFKVNIPFFLWKELLSFLNRKFDAIGIHFRKFVIDNFNLLGISK